MTNDQILLQLMQIFSELTNRPVFDISALAAMDSNLKDDLGIDSVENLDMLHSIENYYAIDISDEEALRLKKVSDIVALIAKKKKGKNGK